jgi:tetratricopeptide (TPR) repeat protein
LVGLAELSLRSGEVRQALELAIRALERDPCDVGAVRILARAGESLGQHDALATWRIANALDPSDLETAIELSRLAAGAGEFAYAIWVLERLRDFQHDLSADFHITLSWLYLSTERAGDARLEAQIARVKDPASSGVFELCAHLDSLSSAA